MKMVVFLVRNFQLASIGCYGNEWIATPNLDRIASEGIVFDAHFADHVQPQNAWETFSTGMYDFAFANRSFPTTNSPNIFRALRSAGILSALIADSGSTLSASPLANFALVEKSERLGLPRDNGEATLRCVDTVLSKFKRQNDWLLVIELTPLAGVESAVRSADWGPTVELSDTPEPLVDPADSGSFEPGDELLLDETTAYAEAVSDLDALVGDALDRIQRPDETDELLLAITADRGWAPPTDVEDLNERPSVREDWVHIPLILRLPSQADAGRRICALTQPIDIMPTLVDAFGLPLPPAHGRSLLRLVQSAREPLRPYACCCANPAGDSQFALRTMNWAFHVGGARSQQRSKWKTAYYIKPDDRSEVNDLSQHHLEYCHALAGTLDAFLAASQHWPLQYPALPSPPAPPDSEVTEGHPEPKGDINADRKTC